MIEIKKIFANLEKIIKVEDKNDFVTTILKTEQDNLKTFQQLFEFLKNIMKDIDALATILKSNDNVLISVKDQKILRTCFQVIISFGISPCLIPGLGISLTKRCASSQILPKLMLNDEQKYEILSYCTDFLHQCYNIPLLKSIIITFHLSDYLAALIQLAFAPLKKPGVYSNFTMTKEMYETLTIDRQKYIDMYEYLVANCFQPMLMKEILVLQNVSDISPPAFAKKVIAKEMSRRLTSPGGLLSLIRCFIESHNLDTGLEWKKIDMICRIVSTKHSNLSEHDYIINICTQLKQILNLHNSHYLTTATSCLLSLYDKFNQYDVVNELAVNTLEPFNYLLMLNKSNLPGTLIYSSQEIEHNVLLLHSCLDVCKSEFLSHFLPKNLFILFLINIKCKKPETKLKINDLLTKGIENMQKDKLLKLMEQFLFGVELVNDNIQINENEAGVTVKCATSSTEHAIGNAVEFIIELFNMASSDKLVSNLFKTCLQILMKFNDKAKLDNYKETLMNLENDPVVIKNEDERYMHVLHLLSEMSSSKKVMNILKTNPEIVVDFVETIILKTINLSNDECTMIAIVLLNTILAHTDKCNKLQNRLYSLLGPLKRIASNESHPLCILCKETVSLISSEYPKSKESEYEKALSNVYDHLLPVRAHGIIELTKLIEAGDPETISKRHVVFCMFQEQLKDTDSYIYLSAINGISSLAKHCTNDVIAVLCSEFLNVTNEHNTIPTLDSERRVAELRLKIGDIIVKVTKCLGEMAVVHKSILLNTMLCGCRDEDPFIRASALSNLAEIALVLHYKMGTIIYEVLLCIWSIIEGDKAVECRRAAVMVITSLLKGLGKDTLIELKENILPIYRTLNKLYKDDSEDSVLRLHSQLALDELNDIVKQFLHAELPIDKQFSMLSATDIKFK